MAVGEAGRKRKKKKKKGMGKLERRPRGPAAEAQVPAAVHLKLPRRQEADVSPSSHLPYLHDGCMHSEKEWCREKNVLVKWSNVLSGAELYAPCSRCHSPLSSCPSAEEVAQSSRGCP